MSVGSIQRNRPDAFSQIDGVAGAVYAEAMKVTVQYAEEHFGVLADAGDKGEVVEIARLGKASLTLVPRPDTGVLPKARGRRVLGAGRGEMRCVSDEEWQSMKDEMERQTVHSPLMTTGEA